MIKRAKATLWVLALVYSLFIGAHPLLAQTLKSINSHTIHVHKSQSVRAQTSLLEQCQQTAVNQCTANCNDIGECIFGCEIGGIHDPNVCLESCSTLGAPCLDACLQTAEAIDICLSPIPTLSEWGTFLLAGLLAMCSLLLLRRQHSHASSPEG